MNPYLTTDVDSRLSRTNSRCAIPDTGADVWWRGNQLSDENETLIVLVIISLFAVYAVLASRFKNVVGPFVILVLSLADSWVSPSRGSGSLQCRRSPCQPGSKEPLSVSPVNGSLASR